MLIENRTQEEIELGKRIIKELNVRPQMPIGILAGILQIEEKEAQRLVDDLEYRGSIVKRVTKDFLQESEHNTIQRIQDEIAQRLGEDKIKSLTLNDLETMLKAALERKKILEQQNTVKNTGGNDNKSYIDNLLKSNASKNESN